MVKSMSMRILFADDSPFWRGDLRALLEHGLDCTVFEASNGSEALLKSSWIHPDVVILDWCMPVLDGLGAARALKRQSPELPVLMVTVDKNESLEAAARQAGVLAVFSKMECMELCDFVRQTLQPRAA